ncbi:MAG TPA: NUDIX hydrolase [Oscillatoriaceae cyanobacterium M33_DOE_052]|uniref:NUDIX hydrolase n=1 Tax=Planktothricoides sp. SpSt-374 TaxID=2282167 RepID=A0A7C3ZX22_9CYAN|nr:NUDIX hydrolase [Oscillatoriaceae cyanobacterium M33_DOE_052]
MSDFDSLPVWPVQDRFLELHSRWLTLIGEHLLDGEGNLLEYWRVEKADSVIVLPIQDDCLIVLPPTYRPGLGQATIDFPGGRLLNGHPPHAAATTILCRELGIEPEAIKQMTPLNVQGWAVNSSFSNQKLYSFVAALHGARQAAAKSARTYPITAEGVQMLLQELTCLQCRAVLLEWWLISSPGASIG